MVKKLSFYFLCFLFTRNKHIHSMNGKYKEGQMILPGCTISDHKVNNYPTPQKI